MKPITHNGKTLALYIPRMCRPEGLNFYSNPADGLQFATYQGDEGHTIQPHIHLERTAVIKDVNEVLYLESGKVKVNLYGKSDNIVVSQVLRAGDTIVLLQGGHGFVFMRKSVLIYVKQGAYVSKEKDKRML